MNSPNLIALLLAGLMLAAMPAQAARDDNRSAERHQSSVQAGLSLDEAVAQAERRHNARVVKAQSKKRGEQLVYRIRLLAADGRVFDITVDADSGAEL